MGLLSIRKWPIRCSRPRLWLKTKSVLIVRLRESLWYWRGLVSSITSLRKMVQSCENHTGGESDLYDGVLSTERTKKKVGVRAGGRTYGVLRRFLKKNFLIQDVGA